MSGDDHFQRGPVGIVVRHRRQLSEDVLLREPRGLAQHLLAPARLVPTDQPKPVIRPLHHAPCPSIVDSKTPRSAHRLRECSRVMNHRLRSVRRPAGNHLAASEGLFTFWRGNCAPARIVSILTCSAVLLLTGCGGQSPDRSGVAMNACRNTGATRAQCECAIGNAQAAGISPDRMASEENAGTAIQDPAFVKAVTPCLAQ